ncbi:serine hydrolase domain-containing protein [Kitasatospora sp. NPDC086791]|uniref:serine hydrolase domain-containing protein n=1 Tax=Kitasatospora sp. NPDC086791 TaxID=3155178 RepID=UPI00342B1C54
MTVKDQVAVNDQVPVEDRRAVKDRVAVKDRHAANDQVAVTDRLSVEGRHRIDPPTLSSMLERLARAHRIPGAQLVVHHGGRTVSVAFGEQVLGGGRPVRGDTAFPLASLTKPFTAALVMTLVADGEVALDDLVTHHLPGAGPDIAGTVRQILSHTSGLPAALPEDAARTGSARRWAARHANRQAPVAAPGTAFSYSNVGYALAGLVVEEMTGMDWSEALDAILLSPLDLTPAFVGDVRDPRGRSSAGGHVVRGSGRRTLPVAEQGVSVVEAPVGALALSAEETALFARQFLARPGPLLAAETVAEMRRDQLAGVPFGPYGMADGWGLGWARYRDGGPDWYGHDGTGDGISCHLRFEPAEGTVVVLTTNANTGQSLWADLVGCLRAVGFAVPGPGPGVGEPDDDPGPAPEDCLGDYANGDLRYTVSRCGPGLLLGLGGPPQYELSCTGDLRFTMREAGGDPSGGPAFAGRFLRDPGTGRVEYLQVSGRLARRGVTRGTVSR